MSKNDRDTHFQGFARLLWIELLAHSTFERKSMRSAEYGAEMEQIIAQRAYDLACHIVEQSNVVESRFVENVIAGIPDLDSWPITAHLKPD